MTEIEYRELDLLNFSSQQKPIEFAKAFDYIIRDKATDIVGTIKQDMAKDIFNQEKEEHG
jgi:hypothetical protein